MKILAISDPHYHGYKQNATMVDGVNSRLLDVDKAMTEAQELGKKLKVDAFAITGDVFHERGRIRPSVFNIAYRRLTRMAEVAPIIMSIGNHDMEAFNLCASSIDTFESINGCFVTGGSSGYSHIRLRDTKILGVQYFHKVDDFKNALEAGIESCKVTLGSSPDVILIHQGIDDFDKTGVITTDLTTKYLTSVTDAIVLCGHYHSPGQKDKVVTVGAPLQHNFGDEGDDRGCWLIDTEAQTAEFHKLVSAPKFVTVRSKADVKKGVSGSFVRVISNSPRTADTLEKAAQACGALCVSTIVDKEYTTAHEKTVAISSSPKKMMSDYIKLMPKYNPYESQIVEMWEKVCQ